MRYTKILIFLILFIGMSYSMLYALPYFINANTIKTKVTQSIEQYTGGRVAKIENASIKYLPYPVITINNLQIRDIKTNSSNSIDIRAKKLSINLSPFSSIIGKYKISSIDFNKILLGVNFSNISKEEQKKNINNISRYFDELSIKYRGNPNNYKIKGSITKNNNYYDFLVKRGEEKITINIKNQKNKSPKFNLLANGNISGDGKMDLDLNIENDNASMLFDDFLFNGNDISQKYKLDQKITVSAKINKNLSDFKISDIKIISEIINAKGYISLLKENDNNLLDIDIKVEKAKLIKNTNIKAKTVKEKIMLANDNLDKEYENINLSEMQYFSIPEDLVMKFSSKIQNLNFNNYDIRDLKIEANASHENDITFNISPVEDTSSILSGKIAKDSDGKSYAEGYFKIKGNNFRVILDYLNIRNDIYQTGLKEFMLEGKFLNSDSKIFISDLHGTVDDTVIKKIDITKNDSGQIAATFIIDNINFDNYLVKNHKEKIVNLAYYFLAKINFNLNDRLIRNLIHLRTLENSPSFSLQINNFTIYGKEHSNFNLDVLAEKNILNVKNISINSKDNIANINAIIDVSVENPNIKIAGNIEKLNINDFIGYDPNKRRDENFKLSGDDFIFPNLDNFNNISVDFDIKEIIYKRLKLLSIYLEGEIKDKTLTLENFSGNIFDDQGKFMLNGEVILNNPISFNFITNFTNIDLQKLLYMLFDINNITGTANINGNLSGVGFNPVNLASQLQGSYKIAFANIEVKNFAVPKIIKDVLKLSKNPALLMNIEQDILLQEEKTLFEQGSSDLSLSNNDIVITSLTVFNEGVAGAINGKINIFDLSTQLQGNFSLMTLVKESNKISTQELNFAFGIGGRIYSPMIKFNLEQMQKFADELRELYHKQSGKKN